MTTTAPDTARLRELDCDTRLAWNTYSDRLRELHGEEYERVEPASWTELQTELRRLDRERAELTFGPDAPAE